MTFTRSRALDRSLAQAEEHPKCPIVAFPQPKLFHFKRYDNLQCRSDDGLWRIHSGYVRSLSWSPEGEFVPLGFWAKGDVVGGAILQRSGSTIAQTQPYEAQCLTAVTAEHLGDTYSYSRAVILAQMRQSSDFLWIAHCRQSEQRLLQFVCWLASAFGEPTPVGYRILLKLTHQEIAESIGATRVTITRFLKVLERDGKISWTAHEKIVYNKAFAHSYKFLYRIA